MLSVLILQAITLTLTYPRLGLVSLYGLLVVVIDILAAIFLGDQVPILSIDGAIYSLPYFILILILAVGKPKPKLALKSWLLRFKNVSVVNLTISTLLFALANAFYLKENYSQILYGGISILNELAGFALYIASICLVILIACSRNPRTKIALILLLLCSYTFGPTRGGVIFPLLTYALLDSQLGLLKKDRNRYSLGEVYKNIPVALLAFGLFIAVSAQRFGEAGGLINSVATILVRGDTLLRYSEAVQSQAEISRSSGESLASNFLFMVPRQLYHEKPYPSTFELTKEVLGPDVAMQATFNYSIAWPQFIHDFNVSLLIFGMNLVTAIIIGVVMLRKNTSLYANVFYLISAPILITSYTSGIFDSPAQRSIYLALLSSTLVVVLLKAAIGLRFALR